MRSLFHRLLEKPRPIGTTTEIWKNSLRRLLADGVPVSQQSAGATWRGKTNRELLGFQTKVPMSQPVVLSPARKLGFKFLAAEAAWIGSGDDQVKTIAPYAKKIADLSDDGETFFGAYGPRFRSQLGYVITCLERDRASRQAIVQVWRETPPFSRDVPCTLSWQYLVRDERLNLVATMRSSDVWTGWVYDVFNFSVTAAIVALKLRDRGWKDLKLGDLYLTAGSQHLYDVDVDGARACCAETANLSIAPLNLDEFESTEALITHLWMCAQGEWSLSPNQWLRELYA